MGSPNCQNNLLHRTGRISSPPVPTVAPISDSRSRRLCLAGYQARRSDEASCYHLATRGRRKAPIRGRPEEVETASQVFEIALQ